MRLLIIGMLEGHISTAGQIAISRGATVSQVDSIDAGLHALREGQGADLVMIDIKLPITKFMKSMKGERMSTPVVACGVSNIQMLLLRRLKLVLKNIFHSHPIQK